MRAGDWRPTASLATLQRRAALLATIRAFFATREVLEVETPALSAAATVDPHLHSFSVSTASGPRFLHTSPEFAMKRLLAAGSGSIYQLARVFRADEQGRHHNPEFTLLEWYRVGFDHHQLQDEVLALLTAVLGPRPVERWTYQALFNHYLGVDGLQASATELRAVAEHRGLMVAGLGGDDPDPWRDLLLSHCIEPLFDPLSYIIITDYPVSQAALARICSGPPAVAERFEVFSGGMELANGFHELSDAEEQRRRFEAENRHRQATGLPTMPLDEPLLAALATGLPACAGVALGVDRLLMLAVGVERLEEVIAFPADRA